MPWRCCCRMTRNSSGVTSIGPGGGVTSEKAVSGTKSCKLKSEGSYHEACRVPKHDARIRGALIAGSCLLTDEEP